MRNFIISHLLVKHERSVQSSTGFSFFIFLFKLVIDISFPDFIIYPYYLHHNLVLKKLFFKKKKRKEKHD